MQEYHVDCHPEFVTKYVSSNINKKFGGNLPVHKPVDCRPKLLIGQDECIIKENLFLQNSGPVPKVKISFGRKTMGMPGCSVHLSHEPGVLMLLNSCLKKNWVRSMHADKVNIIFPPIVRWK